ncbi:DUF4115 domain-containing protein [Leptolyngbya cf. ectocarpi LEGE 11479]|uniref:DUF4115 domain-containing protein n=1 Tax=Leptolyngbya cf. ectocarpi LEGE 11479 TaxID=1828722 RepID=A0A929F826_LEPEC|nr:helix-turn-helix domain-containing protein [Leptolyngbya ectocarpi]MBE9068586.1 DUF4115 domain-containing protein [Leptolyngbya cf. ectocarpi LEGE 11479]
MTSYSTVQKQQLSQMGAYLQEKRQEQGKSLEDISLQTYIRAKLLKSVETGDTSDLPQPIFVQGFIRRYADALGLDGANFAKQFPVHSIPDTPRPVPRPATKIDMSYQTADQKAPVQAKPTAQKPTPVQSKPPVGALPLQSEPRLSSTTTSSPPVGSSVVTPSETAPPETASIKTAETASIKTAPPEPTAEKISPPPSPEAQSPEPTKNLTLEDPAPMSNRELADAGLSNLGNGSTGSSSRSKQSAPLGQAAPLADPVSASPPAGDTPMARAPVGESLASGSDSNVNWLPWGIGAAVLVGAIALLGPRLFGGSSDQPTEPTEAAAPQTEVVQAPPPAPEPEPAVSDAPVNLQVEITEAGPSWMSVTVDGEVVFEGLLDPGAEELWEGQESISINVGNAGAAMVSANGSEPVPAGNPGGAEFLTFTAPSPAAE